MKRPNLSRHAWIGVTLVLLFSASMWVYVNRILPPWKSARRASARVLMAADLGDLYPRWVGSRELWLHQRDPYSQEVTREIETAYYGRPLDPSRPGEPRDQQRFAYPLYVAFLMAPFVKLSFPVVQIIFRGLLAVVTILSIPSWLRAIGWRVSALTLVGLVAVTATSIPMAQGLHLQQLALLVAGLLAASAAAVVGGRFFLAGVLLALATVKPQIALLPEAWFVFWVFGDWRKRQRVFWGFVTSISVLVGASTYVLPGWIISFVKGLLAYRGYTGTVSLLSVLVPWRMFELPLAGFMILSVAALCWRRRREPAESPFFVFALALVLAVAVLVVPTAAPPYNQLFLLPAVLLIASGWKDLKPKNWLHRLACIASAAIVVAPWLLAFALVLRKFVFHHYGLGPVPNPVYASMALPFGILALLMFLRYEPSPSPSPVESTRSEEITTYS